MSRLIVCGRDGRPARIIEAEGQGITIGRSSENHVQIDDLNSSRHHCSIHENDGTYELIDKDSRNGLFVNGHRISRKILEPVELGEVEDLGLGRFGIGGVDDGHGAQRVVVVIAVAVLLALARECDRFEFVLTGEDEA